ncbi:MAG: hypothetical protein WCF48_13665, partial [Terriglobales bacterium]
AEVAEDGGGSGTDAERSGGWFGDGAEVAQDGGGSGTDAECSGGWFGDGAEAAEDSGGSGADAERTVIRSQARQGGLDSG